MTVEAREKILSAVNSGMNNQLLGYEIDNILESYAKEVERETIKRICRKAAQCAHDSVGKKCPPDAICPI